jgi:hypothetical protein
MDIKVRFAENLHLQTKIILYFLSPNVDNQVVVGIFIWSNEGVFFIRRA